MKTYQKYIKYLQILNVLSFIAVVTTIIYSWAMISSLPERFMITEGFTQSKALWISKGKLWGDIRLMVTCYLIISLICVYLQVMPFKPGSGKHHALMGSIVNLCICLVFSITIISTIQSVCTP
ncbi:hypothetical protein [Dyadobacter frigoris]|uniref:Uncharacterized protein n=1 Tax=Dyadobacter frigoris TaxID=2576211 RepID=A0A4U6D223_9BACT|nr:hypothetical protein [Dyadobacter frigoris]TKT90686.1 hypothetical protein FDK13_20430 [Dyadobacter frigoris]